jgi:hypothetical protein
MTPINSKKLIVSFSFIPLFSYTTLKASVMRNPAPDFSNPPPPPPPQLLVSLMLVCWRPC